jgi:hypothetical protein
LIATFVVWQVAAFFLQSRSVATSDDEEAVCPVTR